MNRETETFNREIQGSDSTTIVTLPEATAENVFEKKFAHLQKELGEQKKLSWQIVIGVVMAFLIAVGLVVIEVTLFHTRADKDFLELQNQYFREIKETQEKQFESELRLQKQINDLKQPPASVQGNNKSL